MIKQHHLNILIISALAFIIGTSWNDAILSVFRRYLPDDDNKQIVYRFVYVILITITSLFLAQILVKRE
jgi:hypothetical protein